jgi:hypothetical protein
MPTPAQRRYNTRVLWCSALYGASLLAASYAFHLRLVAGPLAWTAALVPALAIVGIFVAVGRYLGEETDEYQRLLMTRQVLWGTGVALSVATVWGFLESFELVNHIGASFVAMLWFVGLGVGAVANRVTEGRA